MPSIPINLIISGDTVNAVAISTLTRSDTGAAPSGVGLPFSLSLVSGAWVGSFTDPGTLPAYYTATISITYSDSSVQSVGGVIIGSGATVAGIYGDISDIRAEMGNANEQQAADPDNAGDPTQISLNEQKAIAFADGYINGELFKNNFATPATVSLAMLRVIFGKLGAWQLYQVRGLQDKNNAFREKYDWAVKTLRRLIRNSQMDSGSADAFTLATGQADASPQTIAPTVDVKGVRQQTTANAPTSSWPYGWGWGWWSGW